MLPTALQKAPSPSSSASSATVAYIDGTQLDFVREGLNEGFKFNNPNERDRCGCGESFRV